MKFFHITFLYPASLALGGVLAALAPGRADISFYASADPSEPAFLQAATAAELIHLGRETFPSVGEGQSGGTPGPMLAPGIPAGGLFPSGSDTALGLLYQTNSLGNDPATPSAGGTLFAAAPTAEVPLTWLGPNLATNSLDLFVDPPDYRGRAQALSFAVRTSGDSPVTVRLYDNENTLLASATFGSANLARIGVLSTNGYLFRVNVHAPDGYLDLAALDLYVGEAGGGVSGDLAELIAAYFPGTDVQSFDLAADHNGSGLATLVELAFGNHPGERESGRFGLEIVSGPDPIVVTHPLDRAVAGLISVEAEWSLNLLQWNLAQPGIDGVTRVVEPDVYRPALNGQTAVDRIRFTIPSPSSPVFVRLNARVLDGE